MQRGRSAHRRLTGAERAGIRWRVSSYTTGDAGSCVEVGPVADGSGRVAVRHSHHPEGEVIVCSPQEWQALIAGVRAGALDPG